MIQSIHGNNPYSWHTAGLSLRSPWIGISRVWLQVESYASLKLGDGDHTSFWNDPSIDNSALSLRFFRLYRVAQLLNGSVSNHLDDETFHGFISEYCLKMLKS